MKQETEHVKFYCEHCNDTGEVEINAHNPVAVYRTEPCQECCEHGDYDHGSCLDCGKDCTAVAAGSFRAVRLEPKLSLFWRCRY